MRMIDADELKEALLEARRSETDTSLKLIRLIEEQPTVDRPRGRWIKYSPPNPNEDDGVDAWDCSECGAMVSRPTNYCPTCGARME